MAATTGAWIRPLAAELLKLEKGFKLDRVIERWPVIAATPIPLAHGERELTRFTVRDYIVEGGVRFVQFDATRAAGFTEALRIAALAEQHGAIVAPQSGQGISQARRSNCSGGRWSG